jgi:hypothetical protein
VAVNEEDISLNQCGELTGIEVTPFATPVIMYGAGFTAGWKGSCVFSAMPTMTVNEPDFSSRERD